MHELLFFMIGFMLGGIIALLAMCLVQMSRSNDTHTSRRDGDDKSLDTSTTFGAKQHFDNIKMLGG